MGTALEFYIRIYPNPNFFELSPASHLFSTILAILLCEANNIVNDRLTQMPFIDI